jgi:hypothetical protein
MPILTATREDPRWLIRDHDGVLDERALDCHRALDGLSRIAEHDENRVSGSTYDPAFALHQGGEALVNWIAYLRAKCVVALRVAQ